MMAAITAAAHGDIVSSLAIQAGVRRTRFLCRHCTAANTINAIPSASLMVSTTVDGTVRKRTGLPPVISTTTAITRTKDVSQPRMKPRPFLGPSLVLRIKMNADSRTGCTAIPRAMRTRSATTPHLVPLADQAAAVLRPLTEGFMLPPDLEGTVAPRRTDRNERKTGIRRNKAAAAAR